MRTITYSGDFIGVQELTDGFEARLLGQGEMQIGTRLAQYWEVEVPHGARVCIWGTGTLNRALTPLLPRIADGYAVMIGLTYKGTKKNPKFERGAPMHIVDVAVDDATADWLDSSKKPPENMPTPKSPENKPTPKPKNKPTPKPKKNR